MDETEIDEAAGEVRPEPTDSVATTTVSPETGMIDLTWNGDRPDEVVVASSLMEDWVNQHNEFVARIAALEKENDAQRTVLTMVRLGRRPNLRDWLSVGMVKMPEGVTLDMRRPVEEPYEDACRCGAPGLREVHSRTEAGCRTS